MNISEILSKCDHTLLAQTATWDEIRAVCDFYINDFSELPLIEF